LPTRWCSFLISVRMSTRNFASGGPDQGDGGGGVTYASIELATGFPLAAREHGIDTSPPG